MTTSDKESIISLLLHDLRPPLQVLRFLTGHLSDSAATMDPNQLAGYLKELNMAVGDLVQSSSAIFTWLEVQRAQFYEGPKPVPVQKFLESVLQHFAQELPDAAKWITIGSTPNTEVSIDSGAVTAALHQLLRNATSQQPGTIELDAVLEQGYLRISVTDNGPGLNERVVESISSQLSGSSSPVLYRYGYRIIIQVLQKIGGTISFGSTATGKHAVSISVPVQ